MLIRDIGCIFETRSLKSVVKKATEKGVFFSLSRPETKRCGLYCMFRCLYMNSFSHDILVYISHIQIMLERGVTVFSSSTKSNQARLEAVQNNFTLNL